MSHLRLNVNGTFDLNPRPLVSTYRQRALFQDRIEREYKSAVDAKALGICHSVWKHADTTTLDCHLGITPIAQDNGIRTPATFRVEVA